MFRTLQNMPGVITIFHSPKNAVSQQLLHQLTYSSLPFKSTPSRSNGFLSKIFGKREVPEADKYTLDIQSNKLPTFNQYLSIIHTLSIHPDCKESFKKAFPKLSSEIKNSVIDLKTPNEFEFYSDFCDGKDFFKPPLVIDWENALIATDEQGVDRILQHYKRSHAAED